MLTLIFLSFLTRRDNTLEFKPRKYLTSPCLSSHQQDSNIMFYGILEQDSHPHVPSCVFIENNIHNNKKASSHPTAWHPRNEFGIQTTALMWNLQYRTGQWTQPDKGTGEIILINILRWQSCSPPLLLVNNPVLSRGSGTTARKGRSLTPLNKKTPPRHTLCCTTFGRKVSVFD